MSDRKTALKSLLNEVNLDDMQYLPHKPAPINMASLTSGWEEATNNPDKLYRICDAIARQYRLYPALKSLMLRKWGAKSLKEVPLTDLKALFYCLRGIERLLKCF